MNPYAYLDDAPLEERRARAVQMRRTLPTDFAEGAGALDPEAIALVASEAWPVMRDADELLTKRCWVWALLPPVDGDAAILFAELAANRRAATLTVDGHAFLDRRRAGSIWCAAARLSGCGGGSAVSRAARPRVHCPISPERCAAEILRGWFECSESAPRL